MKKILLTIIALISSSTAVWAQEAQTYTLDLQNGSFLLKQDGKVIVTPEKDSSLFVIKTAPLMVDTIIVSKNNRNKKSFTVKSSGNEVMKAKVAQKVHVGEEDFTKPLLFDAGDYELTWGNNTWKVKLLPTRNEVENKKDKELKESATENATKGKGAKTNQRVQKDKEQNLWKIAFFASLGVIVLLFAGICRYLRKQISLRLKQFLGKRAVFIENENFAELDLKAYARQNKKIVKYEDGSLTRRNNENVLVINVGDKTVKGNQLEITLKDAKSKINTIVYYIGEKDPKPFAEGKIEGNVVFYKIDREQAVKQIVIYPAEDVQFFSITSLTVETVEIPAEKPKEEPKQLQCVEGPKEEPLMSKVFQETLMGIFKGSDEYKDLDENKRLVQLQKDIVAARNYKPDQQKGEETPSTSDIEKDVENKVKREFRDKIRNSMEADNYLRTLAIYKNTKDEDPEVFFIKLVETLKNIGQQKKNAPVPAPSNIENERKNPLTKLQTIDNTPDELREGVYTFDTYVTRLKEFFAKLKEEKDAPQEEPRDMVKELVNAVNMKLPDDKKLDADGDVEAQLKTRLSLPTNFDEAEHKAWNAVAEALGIDMVDAKTLEDAINNKVQGKIEKQQEEKQAVKDAEIEQLLAGAEQQALEEVKSKLSGTIDKVDRCKNLLEVVQKAKSAISGAQQRENNALAKVREAYSEVVGQNLPEEMRLKDAIKRFKEDVPKSVSQQEWEKVGDAITSLGFAEVTNVSEATLSSALGNYYQGRLQKEVTSQLNHLKADPSDAASVLNELNHALDMTNEAEILCSKYDTKTITELKDKLVAETTAMKQQKEEVEKQKAAMEKESLRRAEVISTTVDILRQRLTNGVEELDKLINKAGYMKPISSDDSDSEEMANHNQEAMKEQYDSLQKVLLAALPKDYKDVTPAEAIAKVQKVLEDDLAKAFDNKDFSHFSVIDKVARYYAYSRLPFMTENGQEADEAGSLRSYGVVFNRTKMTAIFTQMNQLLTDFGLQLIVPTLFAERLTEGHYQRSANDGDLAILCPHPEYWKQTISNSDKKDIIIDIAATGYYKNGKLVKETEILINNN